MNILIVEDDFDEQTGLVTMVKSLCATGNVFGASNSEDAFALLMQHKMDLIFLDIRLPGESGLTLLEKIRARFGMIPTVITSAYADFSYAQSAIRYGVIDYLLKPIRMDQVRNILEFVAPQGKKAPKKHVNYSAAILEEWLYNPLDMSDTICSLYGISQNSGGRLILIRACPSDEAQKQFCDQNSAEAQVRVRKVVDGIDGVQAGVFSAKQMTAVLLLEDQPSDVTTMLELILNCLRNLTQEWGVMYSGAITEYFQNIFPNAQKAYRQALDVLDDTFYFTDTCISSVKQKHTTSGDMTSDFNALRSATSIPELTVALEKLFDCTPTISAQRFQYNLHVSLRAALEKLLQTQSEKEDMQRMLNRLMEYPCRASALKTRLLNYLGSLTDNAAERNALLVEQVKDYISGNYGDANLSLTSVAKRFYITPAYLGSLFKHYAGDSFNVYLNRYRIERACDLVLHSEKKIYEIAQQCGFNDSKYFMRVFKELTGKTPGRFRKENSI